MDHINISPQDLSVIVAAAVAAELDKRDAKHSNTLVSRKITAQRLGVDVSTLWRWAKTGYLQPLRIGGKVSYREEAIIEIENGKRIV